MLSAEMNQRLTQVGPETPGGALLRRYWQPAALVEELAGERPLKAVRLLGEDLVLFRDPGGRYGLMDKHCSHRGADLCFGRLEAGGLRCPFHGWLYDVDGNCLEQPAEPAESNFHRKVRQPAYAVAERNGVIFAYLGPGPPPPLPGYDFFSAPEAFTFAFKGYLDCNWLQALEVGIDPAHASYLHRFFEDEAAETYGQQFQSRVADTDLPVTQVLRNYPNPEIQVDKTDYGLRIFARRELDDGQSHLRVTNLVFPGAVVIPMSNDMIIAQWHVPVDDLNTYWYAIFVDYRNRVDKKAMRDQRLASSSLPDYKSVKNRHNGWGYDAAEQRRFSYTGMGRDINIHDQWAVESPGALQDRTKEHLGSTDKAIIANRKLLSEAIDRVERGEAGAGGGSEPPIAIDTVAPTASWRQDWKQHDLARRAESEWAQDPWP